MAEKLDDLLFLNLDGRPSKTPVAFEYSGKLVVAVADPQDPKEVRVFYDNKSGEGFSRCAPFDGTELRRNEHTDKIDEAIGDLLNKKREELPLSLNKTPGRKVGTDLVELTNPNPFVIKTVAELEDRHGRPVRLIARDKDSSPVMDCMGRSIVIAVSDDGTKTVVFYKGTSGLWKHIKRFDVNGPDFVTTQARDADGMGAKIVTALNRRDHLLPEKMNLEGGKDSILAMADSTALEIAKSRCFAYAEEKCSFQFVDPKGDVSDKKTPPVMHFGGIDIVVCEITDSPSEPPRRQGFYLDTRGWRPFEAVGIGTSANDLLDKKAPRILLPVGVSPKREPFHGPPANEVVARRLRGLNLPKGTVTPVLEINKAIDPEDRKGHNFLLERRGLAGTGAFPESPGLAEKAEGGKGGKPKDS